MTEMSVSYLRSLGITFVSRYLSDFPSKNLSLGEAIRLSNGGIDIVSNWEDDVDTFMGGYSRGVRDAKMAWSEHKQCGGPDGRPIYFSVDEDVNPQNQTLHDYFRGLGAGMTPGQIGVYGSTGVCRALKAAGLAHWTWRTMSTGWSGGAGDPSEFNVEQTGYINSNMDRDASITDDFGQWRVGQLPMPTSGGGGESVPTVPTHIPSPSGDELPSVPEVWGYHGTNAHGAPDQNDVHQSLLDARDAAQAASAKLDKAGESLWGYKNSAAGDTVDMRQRLVDLEAMVARIVAKLGA